MQIFIHGLKSNYALEASDASDLFAAIHRAEGADEVLLYASGQPLTEHSHISEHQLVEVNLPLKGGKQHGSMARAGKVRDQTPKVEPQEKKKKKTGRAKRRMQYNKRFVNVVETYGRRRGPNSNQ